MNSPIELSSSLVVGSVKSVSPSRIVATLDIEAPQTTALNTGYPRGFPKINSYVLLPNEAGAVVGFIVWIGIEDSMYPKRKGMEDFGLIDLPFPMRKIHIVPVGMLQTTYTDALTNKKYSLKRGITAFPSLGDKIVLPNKEQYEAIIGEAEGAKNFTIGHAPMANNAQVRVDTDKLFGRHLAILGNTGSGKSCSMAGMIRWSLENAKENKKKDNLNARFIVFDPNGEYKHTFSDFNAKVFQVDAKNVDNELRVPAWLWDSEEWSIFTRATKQAQKPLLDQSLKEIKTGTYDDEEEETDELQLYRLIKNRHTQIKNKLSNADEYSGSFGANMNFGNLLEVFQEEIDINIEKFKENSAISLYLNNLNTEIGRLINARSYISGNGRRNYNSFSPYDLESIIDKIKILLKELDTQGLEETPVIEKSAGSPTPFKIDDLPNYLEFKSIQEGSHQYIKPLISRIQSMLADVRMKPIISNDKDDSLLNWLENYVGKDQAENGNVTVIDLSLVPSEITHIITSVISRVVFESIQRYRKLNDGKSLPTVIAVEEAHNFIKKYNDEDTPASVCTKTFEKIAREGRKYGLGLIISSQRPYELSPTALSQCNTFLLHRIVNDRDQDFVNRLVPDNLDGLLNELPNLPSRQAILVGWATPIPVILNIRELEEEYRPQSDDPEFYDVWTGRVERGIVWQRIIDGWN